MTAPVSRDRGLKLVAWTLGASSLVLVLFGLVLVSGGKHTSIGLLLAGVGVVDGVLAFTFARKRASDAP